jgi:hypothetical protein
MLLQTIAWLFGKLVIKLPLTLGRFAEFPRASPSGIPQTFFGLLGHLITNLPQAMLLLIISIIYINTNYRGYIYCIIKECDNRRPQLLKLLRCQYKKSKIEQKQQYKTGFTAYKRLRAFKIGPRYIRYKQYCPWASEDSNARSAQKTSQWSQIKIRFSAARTTDKYCRKIAALAFKPRSGPWNIQVYNLAHPINLNAVCVP